MDTKNIIGAARTARSGRRGRRATYAVSIGAVLSLACAACSSSGGTGATGTKSAPTSGTQSAAAAQPYNGAEVKVAKAYPQPKASSNCTVGYLNVAQAVLSLGIEEKNAESTVKGLGCKFIGLDANSNANTQLNQFNQLLAQKVKAIIVYPVEQGALVPALAKAKAAGVPVIAINTPADVTAPVPSGYTSDLYQGLDRDVYTRVQALAQKQPKGKFTILGTGIPSPAVVFYEAREEYWGKKLGMTFLGKISAPSFSATDTSTAMTGLLGKYPKMTAVMTINDDVGIAASAVAVRSNRKDILILGDNGYPEGLEAVKSGRLFATYKTDSAAIGKQLAYAAVGAIADPASVPKQVVAPIGQLVVTGR